ncbi:hypothetical protein VFA_000153 [Vibrio furnissii CIP 102972]|nr:hypothetical protein VFA_000153 [Vibrio furnissii CIP 102972]SUQ35276.1 aminotransferase B [Vibrio furnissii]
MLSPGIIPALNRLVPLLTDMDDSILIMTPSYGPFKKAGEYSQRRVVYSALKNQQAAGNLTGKTLHAKPVRPIYV